MESNPVKNGDDCDDTAVVMVKANIDDDGVGQEARTCPSVEGTRPPDEPRKWSNFVQWMQCMCVVTFDLNLGQAIEYIYPPQFTPTEQEVSNICYMAFPDSNSGCMGDTKFHMRLRVAPQAADRRSALTAGMHARYDSVCLPILRADGSHYWGFVYFRQRRDVSLPRGYFQKSFIIVTRLPFFSLFYELVAQLAPRYFDEGVTLIEQACGRIAQWPQLQAGVELNLELFDVNYQIVVPRTCDRKKSSIGADHVVVPPPLNSLRLRKLKSVHEMDLFRSLEFVVEHVYTLWELVLTAEPLVVFGTSPACCSQMVQTLVALIHPLEYCSEVRPYFTIHDSEFKEFTQKAWRSPPSLVLGVTNPFFLKLLKDWPHMLRLVDNHKDLQREQLEITTHGKSVLAGGNHISFKASASSGASMLNNEGTTPGLHSKYKPFLKKDKGFMKKLLHGMKTKRPEKVQTALLRRHFLELTQSFMIPLERYIASLMPLQKDISPFKSAPNASAFKLSDFLATLELSGPQLTSSLKGDWKGLYKRFFNSPNFRGWYETRHSELQLTLQDLQLQALSEANLEHWARDKQEVEIIDMILKLKQKLNLHGQTPLHSNCPCGQIEAQINAMKDLLPADLRGIVNI